MKYKFSLNIKYKFVVTNSNKLILESIEGKLSLLRPQASWYDKNGEKLQPFQDVNRLLEVSHYAPSHEARSKKSLIKAMNE